MERSLAGASEVFARAATESLKIGESLEDVRKGILKFTGAARDTLEALEELGVKPEALNELRKQIEAVESLADGDLVKMAKGLEKAATVFETLGELRAGKLNSLGKLLWVLKLGQARRFSRGSQLISLAEDLVQLGQAGQDYNQSIGH
ncbi:MAG: hypothetical protein IPJ88_10770 [Myxococcales bacterium]|nr:MAG: hypothetical protein IPJ88_10770 [Myxococcales bacterium]